MGMLEQEDYNQNLDVPTLMAESTEHEEELAQSEDDDG
jgi:hypothetical protein